MKRNIVILIICCLAVTVRYFYPPTISSAQKSKWLLYPKKKATDSINDKEQKKGALLNDTAQRSIDNVFASVQKQLDEKNSYIGLMEKNNALLEKTVSSQDRKIKWWEKEFSRLKTENRSLELLKDKRRNGDTAEMQISVLDRAEFVQQIADSVKAAIQPDTVFAEKYGSILNRKTRFVKYKP